jgi:hypothetical protein
MVAGQAARQRDILSGKADVTALDAPVLDQPRRHKLRGIAAPDPMPVDTLWAENVVMWKSDIGTIVQGEIPEAELTKYKNQAKTNCGQIKDLEKNSLFIADWLSLAWQAGHKSATLEKLCNELLKFASSAPPILAAVTASVPIKSS